MDKFLRNNKKMFKQIDKKMKVKQRRSFDCQCRQCPLFDVNHKFFKTFRLTWNVHFNCQVFFFSDLMQNKNKNFCIIFKYIWIFHWCRKRRKATRTTFIFGCIITSFNIVMVQYCWSQNHFAFLRICFKHLYIFLLFNKFS